ncbi:hypothetical protein ACE41H_24540, partial [Paenibacillus enshidis]
DKPGAILGGSKVRGVRCVAFSVPYHPHKGDMAQRKRRIRALKFGHSWPINIWLCAMSNVYGVIP